MAEAKSRENTVKKLLWLNVGIYIGSVVNPP